MHSGAWEIIAETLYWIQLVWILSGFALMAYLALRVFPWRDDAQEFLSSGPKRMEFSTRNDAPATFDLTQSGSKPQVIVAGSYRFEVFRDSSWTDSKD